MERARQKLATDSDVIYKSGLQAGLFDKNLTQDVFEDIVRKLIDVSGRKAPSAAALRSVYIGDPNIVVGVASTMNKFVPWFPFLWSWAANATADAGATISVVSYVKRELDKPFTTYQTRQFLQLEVLADRGIPLAMRMQAEVYWDQKRYDKAIEILERLHNRTYPSNTIVAFKDDVTMDSQFSAPWKRLAEFYMHRDLEEKSDALTKIGALDYQDPDALMAYAFRMKEQENWEAYEQCVSIAATAGDGTACWRLGNFYYQIFQGMIPWAHALPENAPWFHSLFYRSLGTRRPLRDFRKLAIDWYELAEIHNDKMAIRNYAILCREDGEINKAESALLKLQRSPKDWKSPNIVKLRERFYDENFRPKIPSSWLQL